MSRITGSDALKMFEAYAAVYAPQELTEEQVWEEVENWVNSLLEEGYDLSEYTWEEMYEAYLNEDGKWVDIPGKGRRFVTGTGEVRRGDPNAPLAGTARAVKGFFTQPRLTPAQMRASTSGVPMSGTGSGSTPAAEKPERQGPYVPERLKKAPTDSRLDSPIAGKGPKDNQVGSPVKPIVTSTSAPQPPAAPRPAAPDGPKVAPTKPAAPAGPAMGKLGGTTFVRRTPTSAELKAAQAERATQKAAGQDTSSVANAEKALQAAKVASAPKVAPTPARSGFGVSSAPIAAKASVSNVTAPEVKAANTLAAKPNLPSVAPNRATGSKKPGSTFEEYDAFDLVLEYLTSEGHVETVEEALYVMMEMDPETIQSICEGYQELNYKRRNRMTDQAMRHMGKGDDKSWEKAYSIENQRDTQTPEVSKAKAAANRAKGAAKRGKG